MYASLTHEITVPFSNRVFNVASSSQIRLTGKITHKERRKSANADSIQKNTPKLTIEFL